MTEHNRWYDTARAQIAIAATMLTLVIGAAGAGYAVHDFKDTVEVETPASVERNANELVGIRSVLESEHTAIWKRIEGGDSALDQLNNKMDLTLQVVAELRCYITEPSGMSRERCIREQTERRLQALINPSE